MIFEVWEPCRVFGILLDMPVEYLVDFKDVVMRLFQDGVSWFYLERNRPGGAGLPNVTVIASKWISGEASKRSKASTSSTPKQTQQLSMLVACNYVCLLTRL